MASGGSPDPRHPHYLQWQQEPWASMQTLAVSEPWTQKCPPDHGSAHTTPCPHLAAHVTQVCVSSTPSSGIAVGHQPCHRWQPRSWVSVWHLVATWTVDPGCCRTTDPDMVPGSIPGPDIMSLANMSLGGCPVPGHLFGLQW